MTCRERVLACFKGLATGDAIGTVNAQWFEVVRSVNGDELAVVAAALGDLRPRG